ncbi:hypothetical protein [Photobacterium sp. 53610]|uniref:hypothetical protein n=1 Tax=Photobacterium sp. 53610 TaxID=3102789 RepID=UPI002EDB099E
MTELHKNAVAFIQCAASMDTCGNHDENNEIAMFLIGLVIDHERQHHAAIGTKKGRFAAEGCGVGLATAP